jgi:hypothetical protein
MPAKYNDIYVARYTQCIHPQFVLRKKWQKGECKSGKQEKNTGRRKMLTDRRSSVLCRSPKGIPGGRSPKFGAGRVGMSTVSVNEEKGRGYWSTSKSWNRTQTVFVEESLANEMAHFSKRADLHRTTCHNQGISCM